MNSFLSSDPCRYIALFKTSSPEMDVLTALSIVSIVIQFIDFGSILLSNSRKIHKCARGILTENMDVEIIAHDLINLAQSLKRKLPQTRILLNIK